MQSWLIVRLVSLTHASRGVLVCERSYSGMYEMKHYMLMFYQGRIAVLLWKK